MRPWAVRGPDAACSRPISVCFVDMPRGAQAISPLVDRITDIQSDAEFILLVEKDAAFIRLSEDRFYNTYPCIIVTVGRRTRAHPRLAPAHCLALRAPLTNVCVLGCRARANPMWRHAWRAAAPAGLRSRPRLRDAHAT